MTTEKLRAFPDLLRFAASSHGDAVFLPRSHSRGGDPVTFRQLHDDARRVAAGLRSLGVERGERVGLIAENRYEWILCDQACAYIGAVDVPRGTDTAVSELVFILGHADCRFSFVENERAARELIEHRGELPELRQICLMTGESSLDGVLGLDDLRTKGDAWLAENPEALERCAAAVEPDDLLTIIYTSGTTANPKGVMLTHSNVLENIFMVEDVLRFGKDDVALSVLPAWHSYERIMDYVLLFAGSKLVYSNPRQLKDDLQTVRPTIFVAVPRIWEMLHDGIVAHCRKRGGLQRKLLDFALDNCRRIGAGDAGLLDRCAHRVLRRSILPRFLHAMGGNVRLAVSGGGSLPAHVDERLIGMGLPLLNGYGLTETSPVVSVRVPDDNRPGTIGKPIPKTTVEVRDNEGRQLPDGEVGVLWIRGPQVMRGYYRNGEHSARVLVDGWFDSGDLGRIEPDGHIRITGRAKDTIVLAGGENVEPERIETTLKTSSYIEQAVVVGQDQKHLGALLVAHQDCLEADVPRAEWGEHDGLLEGPAVIELFRAEIDRLLSRQHGFRPIERIATFRVVIEPMTIDNGLLTQTMKIKRHVVQARYAAVLDSMFAASASRR